MAGFTPVEEVERISMGPRDMVARVVRDFCREGWVGDHGIPTSMVGLAEEVDLRDIWQEEEEEEEEDTLGEAVGKKRRFLWGWWWILQCWKQSAE